ncbi:glycoside hydrolase family 5 protein [Stutzerimonas urumqiensis]|uniref:glycoside hydrolase family 5 protein n=1 Tax=Stutzerimonas urumqiensis TaxID=638269 RepID=UPI003BAAD7E7
MSFAVFAGARKALVVSIALAAVVGTCTVSADVQAATATASASVSTSAAINSFTNSDWLNGIWRKSAAFSIPATSANVAAFVKGQQVRFADGQVRTIAAVYKVGANLSVAVSGAKLDAAKVGYPKSVSIGSAAPAVTAPTATAPAATAPSSTALIATAPMNNFTNSDWLNGIWRKSAGFSIAATTANKAAYTVGKSVKLADGQVRKIKAVYIVGSNMSAMLDGAALDGYQLGYPKTVSVIGDAPATTAPSTSAPSTSAPVATAPVQNVLATSVFNKFNSSDWVNGIWKQSTGFSIPATTASKAAFVKGAKVKFADGQVRLITAVYVSGSNMTVLTDGALLNGKTVGYPQTVAVVTADTVSAPVATAPAVTAPAPAPVPVTSTPAPTPVAKDKQIKLVGINLSGAGFGSGALPGVHGVNYIYPAESYYKKYAENGMTLVRLPFLWERIQPSLNTELNATELARLMQSLDFAHKYGMKVILDMHNYYRYYKKLIGTTEVPIDAFANAWQRIAQKVLNHPAVYGYGLMNEPYGTNGLWPEAAAAASKAIRTVDKERWIFVAGDRYSSAYHWPQYNRTLISDPFMREPSNKLVYEAHMYMDHDTSGSYANPKETFAPDLGIERVKPFVTWLKQNKLRGYIGEHGVPDFAPSAMVAMDNLLGYLRENCIPMTYWAGGPWWGEYSMSLDVKSNSYRPQLPILKKHAAAENACSSIGPM